MILSLVLHLELRFRLFEGSADRHAERCAAPRATPCSSRTRLASRPNHALRFELRLGLFKGLAYKQVELRAARRAAPLFLRELGG